MPHSAAYRGGPDLVVVSCAECRIEADGRFTLAEQWAWWSDGHGQLLPFCPTCAEREFGPRIRLLESRAVA